MFYACEANSLVCAQVGVNGLKEEVNTDNSEERIWKRDAQTKRRGLHICQKCLKKLSWGKKQETFSQHMPPTTLQPDPSCVPPPSAKDNFAKSYHIPPSRTTNSSLQLNSHTNPEIARVVKFTIHSEDILFLKMVTGVVGATSKEIEYNVISKSILQDKKSSFRERAQLQRTWLRMGEKKWTLKCPSNSWRNIIMTEFFSGMHPDGHSEKSINAQSPVKPLYSRAGWWWGSWRGTS